MNEILKKIYYYSEKNIDFHILEIKKTLSLSKKVKRIIHSFNKNFYNLSLLFFSCFVLYAGSMINSDFYLFSIISFLLYLYHFSEKKNSLSNYIRSIFFLDIRKKLKNIDSYMNSELTLNSIKILTKDLSKEELKKIYKFKKGKLTYNDIFSDKISLIKINKKYSKNKEISSNKEFLVNNLIDYLYKNK